MPTSTLLRSRYEATADFDRRDAAFGAVLEDEAGEEEAAEEEVDGEGVEDAGFLVRICSIALDLLILTAVKEKRPRPDHAARETAATAVYSAP